MAYLFSIKISNDIRKIELVFVETDKKKNQIEGAGSATDLSEARYIDIMLSLLLDTLVYTLQ